MAFDSRYFADALQQAAGTFAQSMYRDEERKKDEAFRLKMAAQEHANARSMTTFTLAERERFEESSQPRRMQEIRDANAIALDMRQAQFLWEEDHNSKLANSFNSPSLVEKHLAWATPTGDPTRDAMNSSALRASEMIKTSIAEGKPLAPPLQQFYEQQFPVDARMGVESWRMKREEHNVNIAKDLAMTEAYRNANRDSGSSLTSEQVARHALQAKQYQLECFDLFKDEKNVALLNLYAQAKTMISPGTMQQIKNLPRSTPQEVAFQEAAIKEEAIKIIQSGTVPGTANRGGEFALSVRMLDNRIALYNELSNISQKIADSNTTPMGTRAKPGIIPRTDQPTYTIDNPMNPSAARPSGTEPPRVKSMSRNIREHGFAGAMMSDQLRGRFNNVYSLSGSKAMYIVGEDGTYEELFSNVPDGHYVYDPIQKKMHEAGSKMVDGQLKHGFFVIPASQKFTEAKSQKLGEEGLNEALRSYLEQQKKRTKKLTKADRALEGYSDFSGSIE